MSRKMLVCVFFLILVAASYAQATKLSFINYESGITIKYEIQFDLVKKTLYVSKIDTNKEVVFIISGNNIINIKEIIKAIVNNTTKPGDELNILIQEIEIKNGERLNNVEELYIEFQSDSLVFFVNIDGKKIMRMLFPKTIILNLNTMFSNEWEFNNNDIKDDLEINESEELFG